MVNKHWVAYLLGCMLAPSCWAHDAGAFASPSKLMQQPGAINTERAEITASDCSHTDSKVEREDCRRSSARIYPMGAIKSIKIRSSRYFDADGNVCRKSAGPRLSEARIRHFLNNSAPVSQLSVMNYYGQQGECTSDNVQLIFSHGKAAHFSLSSEGKVGYLSPLRNGKEVDVFFYYCEDCSQ